MWRGWGVFVEGEIAQQQAGVQFSAAHEHVLDSDQGFGSEIQLGESPPEGSKQVEQDRRDLNHVWQKQTMDLGAAIHGARFASQHQTLSLHDTRQKPLLLTVYPYYVRRTSS